VQFVDDTFVFHNGQQAESLLPSRRGQPLDGLRPASKMAPGLFLYRTYLSAHAFSRVESYGEDHSLRDWWVAELTSPEAFAESRS